MTSIGFSRAAKTAGRIVSASAAVLVASLISVSGASAANFFLSGGTPGVLPPGIPGYDTFVPPPATAATFAADGIASGTAITIFDSTSAIGTDGLFVSPQPVKLSFEFMGFSASFTDTASSSLAGGLLFTNQTDIAGTIKGPYVNNAALVPFSFCTGAVCAPNGGAISPLTHIAFAITADPSVAYAFFDDPAQAQDADYNDIIVRISAQDVTVTPLPAALPLFAGGLGVFGLVGLRSRRRRKKQKIAIPSA